MATVTVVWFVDDRGGRKVQRVSPVDAPRFVVLDEHHIEIADSTAWAILSLFGIVGVELTDFSRAKFHLTDGPDTYLDCLISGQGGPGNYWRVWYLRRVPTASLEQS